MKILILPSENYVTKESPLSGIFQYHQSHFLRARGYQVDVLSFGFRSSRQGIKFEKSRIHYENDHGIHVYRYYKNKFLPMRFYKTEVYLRKIFTMGEKVFKQYVKTHGMPDVIYAHNTLYAGAFAKYLKETYKIPYVITEHSSLFLSGRLSPEQKSLSFDVFRNASGLSAVSGFLSEKIQDMFPLLKDRFINIGNLIDPLFTVDMASEPRLAPKGTFKFLNIANVNDNKDQLGLVEAFHQAFSNQEGYELLLGGDGPNLKAVGEKIKDLGLESKVRLLGLLSREEVKSHMKACDVFVLNSQFETFGVVVIEAMACGKPVLCSKCGGPEELIKPYNGVLFDKKLPHALADAMQEMVANYEHYAPDVIQKYVFEHFFGDNYIKKIELLLEGAENDCNC